MWLAIIYFIIIIGTTLHPSSGSQETEPSSYYEVHSDGSANDNYRLSNDGLYNYHYYSESYGYFDSGIYGRFDSGGVVFKTDFYYYHHLDMIWSDFIDFGSDWYLGEYISSDYGAFYPGDWYLGEYISSDYGAFYPGDWYLGEYISSDYGVFYPSDWFFGVGGNSILNRKSVDGHSSVLDLGGDRDSLIMADGDGIVAFRENMYYGGLMISSASENSFYSDLLYTSEFVSVVSHFENHESLETIGQHVMQGPTEDLASAWDAGVYGRDDDDISGHHLKDSNVDIVPSIPFWNDEHFESTFLQRSGFKNYESGQLSSWHSDYFKNIPWHSSDLEHYGLDYDWFWHSLENILPFQSDFALSGSIQQSRWIDGNFWDLLLPSQSNFDPYFWIGFNFGSIFPDLMSAFGQQSFVDWDNSHYEFLLSNFESSDYYGNIFESTSIQPSNIKYYRGIERSHKYGGNGNDMISTLSDFGHYVKTYQTNWIDGFLLQPSAIGRHPHMMESNGDHLSSMATTQYTQFENYGDSLHSRGYSEDVLITPPLSDVENYGDIKPSLLHDVPSPQQRGVKISKFNHESSIWHGDHIESGMPPEQGARQKDRNRDVHGVSENDAPAKPEDLKTHKTFTKDTDYAGSAKANQIVTRTNDSILAATVGNTGSRIVEGGIHWKSVSGAVIVGVMSAWLSIVW